jgi:uncharacterized membrane protein (UPF0127 family)
MKPAGERRAAVRLGRALSILVFVALFATSGPALRSAEGASPKRIGGDWTVAILPSGEEFSLELAVDPEKRALGYMFRDEVGPNEGMLFVFESVERHGIWMKNCRVALDLIWLDERFRVLEVAPDQQPCSPDRRCPTVQPLKAARYVLEVAAGNAKRHGLVPGAQITILTELPRS